MLRLNHLKVSGFRGFTREQEFDFGAPMTLLFGENGTGKSSALNSIEWVLFGKDCVGAATGIRERVGWEVANRDTLPPGAAVTAQFTSSAGTVTVSRSLHRATGTRLREHLKVLLPDGSALSEAAAAGWLAANISCSFRDFLTMVYQHQEVIRAVLTQEARDRNDALDRLLGLSDYRNVVAGIDGARVGRDFKEASGLKDGVSREVESALRLREADLQELSDKALASGLDPSDLTEEGGIRRAAALTQDVARFIEDGALGEIGAVAPRSADGLQSFCQQLLQSLRTARGEVPALSEQQQLLNRRTTVARLQQDLNGLKSEREQTARRLRDHQQSYGSQEGLGSRILDLESKEGAQQEHLREMNAKAPLLREATTFMESLTPERLAGRCPLCGQQSPNLLEELRIEWTALVDARIKKAEEDLRRIRDEKADLVTALSAWQQADDGIAQLDERLSRFREVASRALEMEVGSDADIERLLQDELRLLQTRLDAVERAVKEKMQAIDAFEEDLQRVKMVVECLELAEKAERLNAIWESREFQEVETAFAEAAQFYQDVEAIKKAVSAVAIEQASSKVARASGLVDRYFRETANHPGVAHVRLEVTADRYSRNSYSFADDAGRDLLPILSQGDMNCLALSIFLALGAAGAGNAPFDFLLLDDPSQSLGSEEKRSVAFLLKELSQLKGVTVATMDNELKAIVLSEFPPSDVTVYNFTSWSPTGGPQIEGLEPR